jgi:hypothetical protein
MRAAARPCDLLGSKSHPVSGQMPGFFPLGKCFCRVFSLYVPGFDNFCPVWEGREESAGDVVIKFCHDFYIYNILYTPFQTTRTFV